MVVVTIVLLVYLDEYGGDIRLQSIDFEVHAAHPHESLHTCPLPDRTQFLGEASVHEHRPNAVPRCVFRERGFHHGEREPWRAVQIPETTCKSVTRCELDVDHCKHRVVWCMLRVNKSTMK